MAPLTRALAAAALCGWCLAALALAEWAHGMTARQAIRQVFGRHSDDAIRVARCESGLHVWARNGQYLGLFQMGSYARSTYGHSNSALGQARAAFRYFIDSGRDWSPWTCKP